MTNLGRNILYTYVKNTTPGGSGGEYSLHDPIYGIHSSIFFHVFSYLLITSHHAAR